MTGDNGREAERVWQLMNKIGFAMLAARDDDELCDRTMVAA